MKREVKTYEWVCDRCGVVEETRVVIEDWTLAAHTPFEMWPFGALAKPALPSEWKEDHGKDPRVTSFYPKHVCGGCAAKEVA